jgi:hypothetical protein
MGPDSKRSIRRSSEQHVERGEVDYCRLTEVDLWITSNISYAASPLCAAGRTIVKTVMSVALLLSSTLSIASDVVPEILPTTFGEAVDRDVKAVREATAAFRSVENAQAAGYEQETDCVEHPSEGAMGYHFTRRELRDGVVDVGKPEVLVYEKRPDGSFKLNGVEYLVPIDAWKQSEPPTVMGQPMKRFDRGGFYFLHAWIWGYNPSGLFADWNPRVKCKPASM